MSFTNDRERQTRPSFNQHFVLKGLSAKTAERINLMLNSFRKKIFEALQTDPKPESRAERVQNFKKLYRKYYGIKLSNKKAEKVFESLVSLLRTVRRGIEKPNLPLTGT